MSLTGEEKVALLLATLPPEIREQVLRRLGQIGDDLRRRLQDIDRLAAPPDLLQQVARELEEALNPSEPATVQPVAATRARQAYGGSVPPRPEGAGPPDAQSEDAATNALVQRLRRVPPAELARLLAGEPPAIVAAAIQALGPTEAARLLPHLPADRAAEVSRRLLSPATTPPRVTRHILRRLVERLEAQAEEAPGEGGQRLQWLAETIRRLPSAERATLLARLAETDPETVNRLRRLVYRLDDLTSLPDDLARRLIQRLDARLVAAATADASLPVRNKVLRLLPPRVSDVVRDLWSSGELSEEDRRQAADTLIRHLEELEKQGESLPLGAAA